MANTLSILGELSDGDVDWMIEVGERQPVAVDTVLIHEGKPAEALYVILTGTLAVSVSAQGNRMVAELGSGEIVGEMSFVDTRPPSATVKTLEDSIVLSIPRSLLMTRLQQDADFAARFYRAVAVSLSNRLREMDRRSFYGGTPQTVKRAE